MTFESIIDFLVKFLPQIATIIALIIGVIKYAIKAFREKNWKNLVSLILKYMQEAEGKFDDGQEREEWVIALSLIHI